MLSTDWNAASWKAVAKYYRDLWIKTVNDVVAAEDELSELQKVARELLRQDYVIVKPAPTDDERETYD